MSITQAMWTGVSGLAAESNALGVVGDNVANSSTIGFKQSRAVFEDILGGAVGQNNGGGVRMLRAQQIFAQGSMVNTGQATDLALSGDGFFVVKGSLDGVDGQFYTRAGQFTIDNAGNLVNPQGLHLQGYPANADGTFQATAADIVIPTAPLAPKPTANITVDAKLDATPLPAKVSPFDPTNPGDSSNYHVPTKMYDSLGVEHDVTIYYVNTGAGTWDYHAMVDDGGEVSGGTVGQPFEIASGALTFTSDGALQDNVPGSGGTVDFVNATPGQAFTFDFGTPIAAGGTGTDGIVQYDGESVLNGQSQDGYSSGSIQGVQIDGNGTIMGVYDNGQQIPVAQLAVAKFTSNDGLNRNGHNLWSASLASGDALLGAAGTGGRGAVVSGALEQSNVDIASQFVEMIAHQRAFQANSKTITTADEMLQEIVQLKR